MSDDGTSSALIGCLVVVAIAVLGGGIILPALIVTIRDLWRMALS